MWLLESEDSETKLRYRLLLGVEFTVGRKGCNLNLDDRSVSRKHATLIATMPDPVSSTGQPLLHLKDTSSFGTRVNKKKAEQNVSTPLNDGDKIIFGSPKSSYWVRFSPLVVTSSCLEKAVKVDLERTLRTLGGKTVNEWGSSCTHLVMQNLSITVKVICALTAQRSVVTIDYFKKLIESIKNVDVSPPEENSFLPKVSASLAVRQISTFHPNIKRKSLFDGKTFIFLSASQMKKMQDALNLAGGSVKIHSEKTDDIPDWELTADGSLIMSPPSSGINTQWVSRIQAVLESYGKRMITDAEIGHAVLSCSVQQYCNPDADPGKPLDPLASQTMRTQTQDFFNSSTQSSMSLILNNSFKNKLNESTSDTKAPSSHHEDVSLAKKASDLTEENTIEPISKKRRRSSDETGGLEDDSNEDAATKKQCLFKIPVVDETHSSTRKSVSSTTLVPDTESQQTFIRPKPTTIVDDSDPEDEEPKPAFEMPKSRKREEPAASSKRGSSPFFEDKSSLDAKDSEERILDSTDKEVLAEDTPSTYGSSLLGKKKPLCLVVEDSEIAEQGTSVSEKEIPAQVKKEKVDPSFEKAMKHSKPLFQDPISEDEDSSKKDDPSESTTQRPALADVNLPEGFLTTRLPIKNQVTKIKRETALEEEDLPQNCIETVFTDLVSKRPSRLIPNPDNATSSQAPEGYSYHHGKLVRNFKKFRKNALARGFSLPMIIGGSDLVTHMASRSKEIDEWMRQTKEQESQQNEDEKRAEEFFNWDSRGKGRKWSR